MGLAARDLAGQLSTCCVLRSPHCSIPSRIVHRRSIASNATAILCVLIIFRLHFGKTVECVVDLRRFANGIILRSVSATEVDNTKPVNAHYSPQPILKTLSILSPQNITPVATGFTIAPDALVTTGVHFAARHRYILLAAVLVLSPDATINYTETTSFSDSNPTTRLNFCIITILSEPLIGPA